MASLFGPDGPLGLPVTPSGIFYEIESVSPGPRTDYVPRANRTIVTCRIDANNELLWIPDMVGSVTVNYAAPVGGLPTTALSRTLPAQAPLWNANAGPPGSLAGQWCTRIEAIDNGGSNIGPGAGPGLNPINGWPVPQWSRYRATFEGLPYFVIDDATAYALGGRRLAPELSRYVIRSRRPKIKEQQVPGGKLFIAGSAVPGPAKLLPPTAGAFVRLACADVQYTWVRVPVQNIPIATLLATENLVNFLPFDIPNPLFGGYNWPTGTLRFAGYDDTDKYQDSTGTWVCDLVYFFEYRNVGIAPVGTLGVPVGVPLGWNYYVMPPGLGGAGVATYVGVTFDGNFVNAWGPKPNVLYPSADFNTLFTPV